MALTLDLAPTIRRTRRRARRRTLYGVGVALPFILLFLWIVGVVGGNVREVEAGRLYRSAQLSGSNLDGVLRRYRIRSVINLRGSSEKAYYRSEVAVCQDLGVAHYDVSTSAYRLPRPKELRDLLAAFDRAPRPILVHCQQGADRSGLASTIYQAVYEGVPLDRAQSGQLTWRYGHFPIFGTWRMDRFFDLYRKTSAGQGLRAWIVRTYPGVYARADGRK